MSTCFGFLNKNRYLFPKMAPRAGFEPATCRLTVECSTAELPGITAWRGVSALIQTLSRFAKRFFQKNEMNLYLGCLRPSLGNDKCE